LQSSLRAVLSARFPTRQTGRGAINNVFAARSTVRRCVARPTRLALLVTVSTLSAIAAGAQAPAAYWSTVDPSTASTLRSSAHDAIDDHL